MSNNLRSSQLPPEFPQPNHIGIQSVIDMYRGAANDNVYNQGREGLLAQMPVDIQSVLDSHLY